MKLVAYIQQPAPVVVAINPPAMDVDFGNPIARDYVERDPYEGDYEITPTTELITLETKNKRMTDHVRINPIPSNYGLITWNGSTLTVS